MAILPIPIPILQGLKTLPGTSLRASWAHGGFHFTTSPTHCCTNTGSQHTHAASAVILSAHIPSITFRVNLQVLVIEGLHPFYDERVRDLVDFKIYLDISDEIKFAWKIQRDMAERGHSLDSIKKSIEARKPDFDAYIDPQKKHADMIIQVRSHMRL